MIRLSASETLRLMGTWTFQRISAQVPAVLIISAFLLIFQTIVLGIPIHDGLSMILGLLACILGLAIFLEGLTIGLMPLGELTGLRLPQRSPLPLILLFACLLGGLATFAEPAVGILRTAGQDISPQTSPLLYYMLQAHPEILIIAIAVGVGIAVLLGVLRFQYSWPLKPLILIITLLALVISGICMAIPNTADLVSLAWDSGGITTGPVTVPLVLALGLGISRSLGKSDDPFGGFGIVTLASLVPIISVLATALVINSQIDSLNSLTLLQPLSTTVSTPMFTDQITKLGFTSIQAVVPLVAFLLLVLLLFLREKIKRYDELIFGIIACLVGMFLLSAGIEFGLSRLGAQVGRTIPASFSQTNNLDGTRTIQPFDIAMVQDASAIDGSTYQFFYLKESKGIIAVPFNAQRYDANSKTYQYVPTIGPLFPSESPWGYVLILLFAFLTGYGATRAEPALMTMGSTVEELTVGILKKKRIVQSVAFGVGLGLSLGIACLLWEIPIFYILAPIYALCLVLNYFASESTVSIAWDAAGVTTGPVTVPLVLALGMGISFAIGNSNGFGILAMASVCPILVVLLTGIIQNYREAKE